MIAAMATVLAGVPAGKAYASAGCDSVNSGTFNFSVASGNSAQRTVNSFSAGDKLTFTATRGPSVPGQDGARFNLDGSAANLYSSPDGRSTPEATSYTVTGTNDLSLTAKLNSLDVEISLSATCTAATPASTGPTDSQKLRSVQITGTKIVSQTSCRVCCHDMM